MTKHIVAIAEQSEGGFRKVTFEALSEGKRLADQLDGNLTAVVLGSGLESKAAELGRYGAARILLVDDPAFQDYRTDAYTDVLAGIIGREAPDIVVLGATSQGKDLAARLSARLDAPAAMDCVEIRTGGDAVTAIRPMYGGKVLAEVTLEGSPQIFAIRPNAMGISEAAGAGEPVKIDAPAPESRLSIVEKTLETGVLELTEADIIVSGGRGMGGSDYRVVEELAEVLGGAVGASRSAVDEGWRPHSDQVGQTGKTVSPNLYIACGISGAIQHLAGMSSSKVIVAVNKDPEAPIFARADYGVVGDLFEIVPHLTEAVKKLKG